MRAFETVQDVLNNAKELHCLAGQLYQRLHDQTRDDRARMLLGYMIDHEKKMQQSLTQYESHAPDGILGTWLQYTLEEPPQSFIDALDAGEDMNVEQITQMGQRVDTYLVNLFDDVKQVATTDEMRDVFDSLLAMEDQERHTLTRAANSLWEL